MKQKEIGDMGERVAYDYLVKLGLKPLEKNFHKLEFEIDLIFEDRNSEIVFVEVKSQISNSHVSVFEMVSDSKIHKINHGIQNWLLTNNLYNRPHRLDFVGVVFNKQMAVDDVYHIESIGFGA